MSHPASHHRPIDIAREESPAVKSALMATLADELADEASRPGSAVTPEHLAGPGRLHAPPRS
jgi:hypothetical protein